MNRTTFLFAALVLLRLGADTSQAQSFSSFGTRPSEVFTRAELRIHLVANLRTCQYAVEELQKRLEDHQLALDQLDRRYNLDQIRDRYSNSLRIRNLAWVVTTTQVDTAALAEYDRMITTLLSEIRSGHPVDFDNGLALVARTNLVLTVQMLKVHELNCCRIQLEHWAKAHLSPVSTPTRK